MKTVLVWLGACWLMACGGASPSTSTAAAEPAERPPPETMLDKAVYLLEVGISDARPEVIAPLIGDDYRQHNPRVADGPEGLLSFVTAFGRQPAESRLRIRVQRALADGAFVITHSEFARPTSRVAGFDVFRVHEGKFVEHWDVGMQERGPNPSGRGLLDGARPDEASLAGDTEATRTRVRHLVEVAMVGREVSAFDSDVAVDCVQHDPRLADGRVAWAESVVEGAVVHEELVRVVAQGNWAMTQSRGRLDGAPAVISDLFLLANGVVAEHWVVWERIPDRMRHSNGML